MFGSKKIVFNTLINLVHGRDGEDGKIASLMEFFSIPYISPRLEACTLSFNKLYTKFYAQSVGVKTLEYQLLKSDSRRDISLSFPLIVKPCRLGSSIGVSIVKDRGELDYALDVAFEFDNDVLIEPFIANIKEYNLAGCFTDDWELSIIEEPNKEEFLDFDKKYLDFSREGKIVAADIPQKLEDGIKESFKAIYGELFEGSIIRCDFFEISGEIYLNEINPIPGSMANYLFEGFEDMVLRLAKNIRFEKKIESQYTYINSIQSAKGKA